MNKKFLILTLSALCAGSLLNAAKYDVSVRIVNKTDGNIAGKVSFSVPSEGKDGKMTYSNKTSEKFDFKDAKGKSITVKTNNPEQRFHGIYVTRAGGQPQTIDITKPDTRKRFRRKNARKRKIEVEDDEIEISGVDFKLAD